MQAWIGLKKAVDDQFYWVQSGKQLENQDNLWSPGKPEGPHGCVFIDLSNASHVRNSFDDDSCSNQFDVSICQIPYV